MTPKLTPEVAAAAAETALAFIPTGEPLTVASPTNDYDAEYFNGTVVRAQFTGVKGGEVLIAVEQTVADALANSPLGQLELTAALNPALEAVVSGFGNVRLSPAEQTDVVAAFTELLSKQDAYIVPLEFEGVHRAMVGLAVTQDQPEEEPAGPAAPSYPTRDEMVSQQAEEAAAAARMAQMQAFQAPPVQIVRNGLELLRDVAMEVTAQIGSTKMTVSELLSLTDGAVIELDRNAGAPADLLVNGHLIARGEVVVIDENFGLRITEIVTGEDSETGADVAEMAAHR